MENCLTSGLWKLYLPIVLIAGTDGTYLTENIALNKTAVQISTFYSFTADKAVDGSTDDILESGSCTHTDSSDGVTALWWQVDLQDLYVIQSVIITNRGDCCGARLRDFSVLLYNIDPQIDDTNPKLCSLYPNVMSAGETIRMVCRTGTSGRFLRVQFNDKQDDWLTLCEVEVRGYKPSEVQGCLIENLVLLAGSRETSYIVATHQNVTKMDCVKACYYTSSCLGFNYRETSNLVVENNCELFTQFVTFSDDSVWDVYHFE